jgi:hypothetical protein
VHRAAAFDHERADATGVEVCEHTVQVDRVTGVNHAGLIGSDLCREIIALRDAEYVQLSSASRINVKGTHDADRV